MEFEESKNYKDNEKKNSIVLIKKEEKEEEVEEGEVLNTKNCNIITKENNFESFNKKESEKVPCEESLTNTEKIR